LATVTISPTTHQPTSRQLLLLQPMM